MNLIENIILRSDRDQTITREQQLQPETAMATTECTYVCNNI